MEMTKTQFYLNVIFFIPFMVINFFLYGIEGLVMVSIFLFNIRYTNTHTKLSTAFMTAPSMPPKHTVLPVFWVGQATVATLPSPVAFLLEPSTQMRQLVITPVIPYLAAPTWYQLTIASI